MFSRDNFSNCEKEVRKSFLHLFHTQGQKTNQNLESHKNKRENYLENTSL